MQHDALPALDATATEQATLTALGEIVCTDASCLQATSHVSLCECRGCDGADHGKQQDRAGLIPAKVAVDQAARRARNLAAVFAASADLDEAW
jgi:hypothetical protein